MQNIEFDKRVKEIMDGHLEMPGEGSWEKLQLTLNSRNKARVLYFRRGIYASVAVAASLLLLLVLDKETPAPASKDNINNLNLLVENAPKPKIHEEIAESNISKIYFSEKRGTKERVAEKKNEQVIDEQKEVSRPAEKRDKKSEKSVTDDKTYQLLEFEDEPVGKKNFTKGLLYALSTNLSPSLYGKSINMLSVSRNYNNDFVPTNLKETIQPQSVSETRYAIPLSFGLQVQLPVNDKLSVGAGFSYSLLVSQYQKFSYDRRLDIQQNLHYVGIPLNAYYRLLQNNKLKLYVAAGIAIEKGILANYRIVDNGVKDIENHSVSGVQFSISGGLGTEFKLNNEVGLYFDPSLAYYFKCNQPDNIRTAQQLQYKFELGMRFHL